MSRAAGVVAAGLFIVAGCKTKPPPPVVDAAPVAIADSGAPELPRLAGLGESACLLYPSGKALCAQPTPGAIAFRPLEAEGATDTAHRRACFLTNTGEAVCDGKRIGHDLKSVSGAPYLLGADGIVIATRRAPTARRPRLRSATRPRASARARAGARRDRSGDVAPRLVGRLARYARIRPSNVRERRRRGGLRAARVGRGSMLGARHLPPRNAVAGGDPAFSLEAKPDLNGEYQTVSARPVRGAFDRGTSCGSWRRVEKFLASSCSFRFPRFCCSRRRHRTWMDGSTSHRTLTPSSPSAAVSRM